MNTLTRILSLLTVLLATTYCSSGSSPASPSVPVNQAPITGLDVWYGASFLALPTSEYVTTPVIDLSGNFNNCNNFWGGTKAQGNVYYQSIVPVLSNQASFLFLATGAQSGLDCTGLTWNFLSGTGYSIFLVYHQPNFSAPGNIFEAYGTTASVGISAGVSGLFATSGLAGNILAETYTTPLVSALGNTTLPIVVALVYDSTQSSNVNKLNMFANGVALTGAISGTNSNTGANTGTVSETVTGFPSEMYVPEILIYGRTLMSSEINSVQCYLGRKYNITVTGC